MALPNSNISVAMVRNELGASTNNVGQLCIHPNINKWSKWKPVRHPKVGVLTYEDFISTNFGISFNRYPTGNQVKAAIDTENETWPYARPRGGDFNEPFRIGDFRGYDHTAVPPVGIGVGSSGGVPYSVNMGIDFDPVDPFLPPDISDYYWAITFQKADNSLYTVYSDYTVGDIDGFSYNIDKDFLGYGTSVAFYYLVPIVAYDPNIWNPTNLHLRDVSAFGGCIAYPLGINRSIIQYLSISDSIHWDITSREYIGAPAFSLTWTLTCTVDQPVTIEVISCICTYEGDLGGSFQQNLTNAWGTFSLSPEQEKSVTRGTINTSGAASIEIQYTVGGENFVRVVPV